MNTSDKRWVAWLRHCDGASGVVEYSGRIAPVIEQLQRNWTEQGKATGCSYKATDGGLVAALVLTVELGG